MKRFLDRGGLFLPITALAWLGALAAYLFVLVVDPYELRWARASERLADHAYPVDVVPRLASVAANEGADMAIVGASTALGYTPAMMRSVFPDVHRPVNLAYPCATEEDLALILPRLERSKSLKRLIISLDYTMVWRCVGMPAPMDKRYFALPWYEPVPEYNPSAVRLAARVLRTGVLDAPEWRPQLPDSVDGVFTPPVTASDQQMAEIRRDIMARPAVADGAPVSCAAIPALTSVIQPSIRRLAARGVSVDLLAPPYSLAFYWSPAGEHVASMRGSSFFTRVMAIRRCALQMSAGIPNVRFHSFDTDLSVVGDLAHYSNPAHLNDYGRYKYVLTHIAAGDATVTAEQWPSFEAQVKRELAQYRP